MESLCTTVQELGSNFTMLDTSTLCGGWLETALGVRGAGGTMRPAMTSCVYIWGLILGLSDRPVWNWASYWA